MSRYEIIAECVIDTKIDLEMVADENAAGVRFDMVMDSDPLQDDTRIGTRLCDGFAMILGSEL